MLKKILIITMMVVITGCVSTKSDTNSTQKANAVNKIEFTESDTIQLKFKANGQIDEKILSSLKGTYWEFLNGPRSSKKRYKGGWSFTNTSFKYESKGCLDNDFGGCNGFSKESFVKVTGELTSDNQGDIVNISLKPKDYIEYKATDLFGNLHAKLLSGDTNYSGNKYSLLSSLSSTTISVKEEINSEYTPESVMANFKRFSSYGNSEQDFSIEHKGGSYVLKTKSGAIIHLKVEVFPYRKGSKAVFIATVRPVIKGNSVDFDLALSEFKSSINSIVKS
jgi:hypothetical protein